MTGAPPGAAAGAGCPPTLPRTADGFLKIQFLLQRVRAEQRKGSESALIIPLRLVCGQSGARTLKLALPANDTTITGPVFRSARSVDDLLREMGEFAAV